MHVQPPGSRTLLHLLVLCATLLPLLPLASAAPRALAAEPRQADSSELLVADEVEGFSIGTNKLYWYQHGGCTLAVPSLAATRDLPGVLPAPPEAAAIRRVALLGSEPRELFRVYQLDNTQCNTHRMRSNVVEFGGSLYWVAASGLVRLPTDATTGDDPTPVSNGWVSVIDPERRAEIARGDGAIFVLTHPSNSRSILRRYQPAGGQSSILYDGPPIRNVRAGANNAVYYLQGDDLWRVMGGQLPDTKLLGNVEDYALLAGSIYFARDNKLMRYTVATGLLDPPLYTADDESHIYDLSLSDNTNIFLLERRRFSPCVPSQDNPCFDQFIQVLVRVGLAGNHAAADLYSKATASPTELDVEQLESSGQWAFWRVGTSLRRILKNAAAMVKPNIKVLGVEVTQGVQSVDNTIELIGGRRTVARVYVMADRYTEGVTTYLYRINPSNGQVIDGPLMPVNYPSMYLTLRPDPLYLLRQMPGISFQFELPWEWVKAGESLRLRAVANPYNVPLEDAADKADNVWQTRTFAVRESPLLEVALYSLSYDVDNVSYYNGVRDDIDTTISYIRRTYPLSSKDNDPNAGFRPSVRWVGLPGLGSRMTQQAAECAELEDASQCASEYVHGRFEAWREQNDEGGLFYYGMMPWPDHRGWFPRGFARGMASTGPAGDPKDSKWDWDKDTTIGDWYAAHEIAHSVGRDHPYEGSQEESRACGQGEDDGDLDDDYPYDDGHIGPPTYGSLGIAGFDVGDRSLALPMRYYAPNTWNDFMSYCANQWISDYTYEGMYDELTSFSPWLRETPAARLGGTPITGDFLHVIGSLNETNGTAHLSYLRRVSELRSRPPLVAGPYSIRLLNGAGQQLADYSFTPEEKRGDRHDEDSTPISQVVDYVAGARTLQIVRLSDGKVLLRRTISTSQPQVSNVAVQGAAAPLTGTVTLSWGASDPDGDALGFDVLYSKDGGQSFQPLLFDTPALSATIDTTLLAGSTAAIFRVVASDGVLSAKADSAPLSVAAKAPTVSIFSPGPDSSIQYGQLINFDGGARDTADGSIADAGLTWTNASGQVLATGARFSSDTLAPGKHIITLTATNKAGLKAIASVTITVRDDFALPAVQLTAAPDQIGWQVAPGTAAMQTATLQLGTMAGDTLGWAATSDAPWLTLSASSGSAPEALTLSASPAGVADGTLRSATVTITATDAQGQVVSTIKVPVTLAVGDTWEPDGPGGSPDTAGGAVRLPLVLR